MRAVLVANFDELDAGHVGRVLGDRGFSFTRFVRESHQEWTGIEDASLVVSLGSSWSNYWEQVAAPVRAEQQLMVDAARRGIPILGICFGAQQLACALGGAVGPAPKAEIGWHLIEGEPEDAVSVPDWMVSGPWMQWHYDQFTVPPGATVLARSSAGVQVFRAGTSLGVQFHPEATLSIVSRWSQGEGERELDAAGIDSAELADATRLHGDDAAGRCERLVDWFLSDVAQLHMNS